MESQTAKQIIEVTFDLLVERGYSAFSYADVSEKVGIRKASIHHHFPSKSDLVVAVLRQHREKLELGMQQLDRQIEDPLARLRAYVQHWEGCIEEGVISFCIAALLSAELPSLPGEVQAEVRRHFEVLSSWIERTLQDGVTRNTIQLQGTPAIEAQVLMAAVHGAMMSARAFGSCDHFGAVTTVALARLSVAQTSE